MAENLTVNGTVDPKLGASATETRVENEPEWISLAEAAELVPLSYESLRRVAVAGGDDNPFTWRCGRWMTMRERLYKWAEDGKRPQKAHRADSPMAKPRRPLRQTGFSAKVAELERSAE